MRKLLHSFNRALEWLDTVEFIVIVLVATALMLLGPPWLALKLFRGGHEAVSVTVGLTWLAIFLCAVREFVRHKLGWSSLALAISWIVSLVLVVGVLD